MKDTCYLNKKDRDSSSIHFNVCREASISSKSKAWYRIHNCQLGKNVSIIHLWKEVRKSSTNLWMSIYKELAILPWKSTLKFSFENEFANCTYEVKKGCCKIFAVLSQNGSNLRNAYGCSGNGEIDVENIMMAESTAAISRLHVLG